MPRGTPMLVWIALIGANGAVAWWATRRLRVELARPSVAAAIEREQTLRAGALRGVIEVADRGALGRRADQILAAQLEGRGPSLAPQLHRTSRLRAIRAFSVAAVTLALLLWAAPSLSDGLLAIRSPIAAWRGTLLPVLGFEGLPTELLRGESIRVSIAARGRRSVSLSARATGEGWRTTELPVDSATGFAATTIGPVRGDLVLVAGDGRMLTDTALVRVTDRPFVGGVILRAQYPAYLGRASEGLPVGEPARVPQGTVIEVSGRASTALRAVYVKGERDSVAFIVAGHAFNGQLRPARTTRLEWFAAGASGPIADVPLPMEVEVVPDSAPRVELVSPPTDTVVATVPTITLQITATDDHGIAAVDVVSEKQERGKEQKTIAQRVVSGQGSVWNGTPMVDLSARELGPGDVLKVRVVATDNSPWANKGVSRELVIRVPTMEERRSLARNAADSAAYEARSAAAAQKSLEQRTDEASRERGARNNTNNGTKGAEAARQRDQREKEMSFESAEKARSLAQEQRELTERVDKLRDAAKNLEEQLKQAQAMDSSLQRQLREAQDLLRDALTPDLMAQMQKLENATRELSGDQARNALKDLAEMQKRLREQLEKSAEMLKRAAMEGAMETLKDEAQELAQEQKAMADSSGRMNQEAKREQSDKLANRSERLSKDVEKLQDRLKKEQADAASPCGSRMRRPLRSRWSRRRRISRTRATSRSASGRRS
jgi:hypothetical protein